MAAMDESLAQVDKVPESVVVKVEVDPKAIRREISASQSGISVFRPFLSGWRVAFRFLSVDAGGVASS